MVLHENQEYSSLEEYKIKNNVLKNLRINPHGDKKPWAFAFRDAEDNKYRVRIVCS